MSIAPPPLLRNMSPNKSSFHVFLQMTVPQCLRSRRAAPNLSKIQEKKLVRAQILNINNSLKFLINLFLYAIPKKFIFWDLL